MKKYLFGVVMLTSLQSFNAEAYYFQGDLMFASLSKESDYDFSGSWGSSEGKSETDISGASISAQLFFQDVSLDRGPWDEAAFLDRASSVAISRGRTEFKNNNEGNKSDFDTTSEVFAIRGVIGDFIVEGGGYKSGFFSGGNSNFINLGLGGYIDENQELVFTFGLDRDEEYEMCNIRYKNVWELDSEMYLSLGGMVGIVQHDDSDNTEDTTFGFDAGFYLMNNLGVFASLSSIVKDSDVLDSYLVSVAKVGVSYYPVEQVSLKAGVSLLNGNAEYKGYGNIGRYDEYNEFKWGYEGYGEEIKWLEGDSGEDKWSGAGLEFGVSARF